MECPKGAERADGIRNFTSIIPLNGFHPNHIAGGPGVAAPYFTNNCMIAAVNELLYQRTVRSPS